MSGFTRCGAGARTVPPDPRKRVKFVHGLVLGADDLTQESAYLANRTEWLARDLIGYGTVADCASPRDAGGGPALVVGSGVGVSPRGGRFGWRWRKRSRSNEWLDARGNELVFHLVPGVGSPPGDLLQLFVVLCYRQCATDDSPGPASRAAPTSRRGYFTRIADSFRLELRFDAPDQREDDAVRALASWLRLVEIVDATAERRRSKNSCRRCALRRCSAARPTSRSPRRRSRCASTRRRRRVPARRARRLDDRAEAALAHLAPHDDAVLLAEVDVPLVTRRPDGRWQAADESRRPSSLRRARPYLLPLAPACRSSRCRRGCRPRRAVARRGRRDHHGRRNARRIGVPRLGGLRVDGRRRRRSHGHRSTATCAGGAGDVSVRRQGDEHAPQPPATDAPVIVNIGGYEANGHPRCTSPARTARPSCHATARSKSRSRSRGTRRRSDEDIMNAGTPASNQPTAPPDSRSTSTTRSAWCSASTTSSRSSRTRPAAQQVAGARADRVRHRLRPRVALETDAGAVRASRSSPGVALSPRGQTVRVLRSRSARTSTSGSATNRHRDRRVAWARRRPTGSTRT